jgi:hypothetical protein
VIDCSRRDIDVLDEDLVLATCGIGWNPGGGRDYPHPSRPAIASCAWGTVSLSRGKEDQSVALTALIELCLYCPSDLRGLF